MQDCCLFQLIFDTCACPTSTAVLTVGHFWRCFQQQLDRLRLTIVNRDITRPNKTFIYTILCWFLDRAQLAYDPKKYSFKSGPHRPQEVTEFQGSQFLTDRVAIFCLM